MNIKRIERFFVGILLINAVVDSYAIQFETISAGESFNKRTEGDSATLYTITGNCVLDGDVALAPGSMLKFEGGSITGSGSITAERLIVDALPYKIFGDSVAISGFGNDEVSAHWWGATGDGVTDDSFAVNRALQCAGTSWVVLENMTYRIDSTIILDKRGQRLRCHGIMTYSGSGAAVDLRNSYLELDINELRHSQCWEFSQHDTFEGSGVRFSWNVYNANVDVNKIRFFERGLDLSPVLTDDATYSGIQYCKISWQYIVSRYGIYMDMVSGVGDKLTGNRIWINENQFNGGRLLCDYAIYSTEVDARYNDVVGLINGNVFNCIGIEGEGEIKTTAITLYNAWHNKFNDIRLSEGYVPVGNQWIILCKCGYNDFSFKSQIPFSSVSAVNCSHNKIDAAICDDGLGYYTEFDRMYILNGNPKYNPLNDSTGVDGGTFKLVTRDYVPSSEINRIYLGATEESPAGNKSLTIGFNELFYLHDYNGDEKQIVMTDKCFITVNDNSILNIIVENSLAHSWLKLELFCNVSSGSSIVIVNSDNTTITITESGTYRVRPVGSSTIGLFKMTDTKSEFVDAK